MKTQVLSVDPKNPEEDVIAFAATLLQKGELVAFPTETVYGLGANALDENAVKKIFAAKKRPQDNPLIVHIDKTEKIDLYAKNIPKHVERFTKKFWPGPVTLLLEKKENIPSIVTAESHLVSVRNPDHSVARALIRKANLPIAAPSANLSGRPSPTTAQHVLQDLEGRVALILDSGETPIGVESTVLDITSNPPVILRPGAVTLEEIQEIVPSVIHYTGTVEKPRAPGMKYTHYAPRANVIVYIGEEKNVIEAIQKDYQEGSQVISYTQISGIPDASQHILPSAHDFARDIFSLFRQADEKHIKTILVTAVAEVGIGTAVMNRLKKAATKIINV